MCWRVQKEAPYLGGEVSGKGGFKEVGALRKFTILRVRETMHFVLTEVAIIGLWRYRVPMDFSGVFRAGFIVH